MPESPPEVLPEPALAGRGGWFRRHRATLAVLLLIAVFLGALQFGWTDALIGADGYFHTRFSAMMWERGELVRELPWLQHTIHRDDYRDHHFLFHVLYVPFCTGDLRFGGKLAAWFYATLAVFLFYLVARRRGHLAGFLFTLLLLGAAPRFLTRLAMPRVPSLSMALLLLGAWALMTRRGAWLAVIMFAYVWLYDGFALLVIVMLCFLVAEILVEGRARWSLHAWGLAGLVAGVVLNPYFPENLAAFGFNLQRAAGSQQVVEATGAEWYPTSSWRLLWLSVGVWAAYALGVLFALLERTVRRETVALFLASAFATLLVFKARRYMDTWPPLVLLFAASSWPAAASSVRSGRSRRVVAGTVILVLLALFTPVTFARQARSVARTLPVEHYAGAAAWLEANAAPKDVVFTGSWSDFPYLFFHTTTCYYVVGLDKLYLKAYDEALYSEWLRITRGEETRPAAALRARFGAAWFFLNLRMSSSLDEIARADPGLEERYRDEGCVVYAVLP